LRPGRQIAVSLANHARDLPDLAHAVRYAVVPDATRDNLTAAWKAWIEQAGARGLPPLRTDFHVARASRLLACLGGRRCWPVNACQ